MHPINTRHLSPALFFSVSVMGYNTLDWGAWRTEHSWAIPANRSIGHQSCLESCTPLLPFLSSFLTCRLSQFSRGHMPPWKLGEIHFRVPAYDYMNNEHWSSLKNRGSYDVPRRQIWLSLEDVKFSTQPKGFWPLTTISYFDGLLDRHINSTVVKHLDLKHLILYPVLKQGS